MLPASGLRKSARHSAGALSSSSGLYFQFYSYVLEMTLQVSEASLKCHHCKKSSEDELKAIKTKNDSGAVSYENIRIFIGSLRWYAAALV